MLGIHDFGMFLAAGILLNLTPGQDTLYIVGRSIAQGRGVGVAAALGICTGALIHALAAAVGVSAIIATSTTAFMLLKLAGAAYLIYLGAALMLTRGSTPEPEAHTPGIGVRRAFRQGVLTNLTNPKVALFFLAFLPQFIEPESPTKIAAFLVLGLTFVATSTAWCLLLALAAARIKNGLGPDGRSGSWLRRLVGACFIALGIRLAAAEA